MEVVESVMRQDSDDDSEDNTPVELVECQFQETQSQESHEGD